MLNLVSRATLPQATTASSPNVLHPQNISSSVTMDSPVLTQLFRQLFRHPACQSLRRQPYSLTRPQTRTFLSRRTPTKRKTQDDALLWTKRGDYPKNIDEEYRTYPQVTAKELRSRRERPRQVKMLTREFIDGKFGGRNMRNDI
jgi:hypothetical protein